MLQPRPEKTDRHHHRTRQKESKGVIVVQAGISAPSGRLVSFLFSSIQVEEILTDVNIWPVPFSAPYAEGVAVWRNQMLPVVSLEKRLGFETRRSDADRRIIVVQTRQRDTCEICRGMIAVGPHIRSTTRPAGTHPSEDSSWLPDASAVRGVFEWEQELLMVADLDSIFNHTSLRRRIQTNNHPQVIEQGHDS